MNRIERRHLESMREHIASYRRGESQLSDLITCLELLRKDVESVSDEWSDTFYRNWGELELTYSLDVVRGQSLSENELREVARSVDAIRAVVDTALASLPPEVLDDDD